MSHIVRIATRLHDPVAVTAACQRLQLPAPVTGEAQLYSGTVKGLLVQFPGWTYPAVIDTLTGLVSYDVYNGAWGDQRRLDEFIQRYAVEKARLEARRQGHTVNEQTLADGSIKLVITQGG